MRVKLRLQRFGRKKSPFYRIVSAPVLKKRDGYFLEIIGLYHPIMPDEKQVTLKKDRIEYWLSVGAEPTDIVRNILRRDGFWAEYMEKKSKIKKKKRNRYKSIQKVNKITEKPVVAEKAVTTE